MAKQRARGRPPKFPAEEVRLRLLEAGREALLRDGPGSGLDAVTLDGAIEEAGVPRGSAYRLWQHEVLSPQMAFRVAVQLDILRRVGLGVPAVTAKFKATYGDYAESATSDDAEERKWAFISVLRTVANDSFERLDESLNWRVYQALRSNVLAKSEPVESAVETIRRGEETQIDAYAELYEEFAEVFGVTVREPFTIREFAAAAFALNEGIATRITTGFRRRDILRATGRRGEEESWTLFAVGLEALVNQFFEIGDLDPC